MNSSLINSSVSLQALQQKLDILSNNIANANTNGYKKKQISFDEVLTSVKTQPKDFTQPGRMSGPGLKLSYGVKVAQLQTDFSQGQLQFTGNPLDLALEGNGLFEIGIQTFDSDGNPVINPAWTRDGSFHLSLDQNNNLALTTKEGYFVRNTNGEPIIVPRGHSLQISEHGQVLAVKDSDPNAAPVDLGQIKLVRVVRPQMLQDAGDNLYVLRPNDGAQQNQNNVLIPISGQENDDSSIVKVIQGHLEQSNVTLTDEMAELIMVQRAFQLSSRAISSSDTMTGLANNLRN